MSIIISSVSNNETFAALVQKVNQLSEILSANVVTADASVGGSTTAGNVKLDGNLSANVISVKTLHGGDSTNSGNLVIASNTSITMNNIDVLKISYDTTAANIVYGIVANTMTLNSNKLQFAVANMVFDGANVHINSYLYVDNDMHANGAVFVRNMLTANGGANVSANLTVTGNTTITGKVAVTGNSDLTGSLTVSGNTAVTGNLTANWAGLSSANVTTLEANTLTLAASATVANSIVVGNNATVSNGTLTVGNSTVNTAITKDTAYATTLRANNNLYVGNGSVNTAITPTQINAANVVVANTLTVGENVVVTLNVQANTANAVALTANTLTIANNASIGGNLTLTGNVSGGNVASFKTMVANAFTVSTISSNNTITVGNSIVNTVISNSQITVANLVANNVTVNNLNVPLAINTTQDVNANNVIAVNTITANNLVATVNVTAGGITVSGNAVIANTYVTNANTRTSWTNTATANAMHATTANVVTFRANSVTANTITSAGAVSGVNIVGSTSVSAPAISAVTLAGATTSSLTPLGFKNYIDNSEFTIFNRDGYDQYATLTTLNSSFGYWPCDRWHLYVSNNGTTNGYPFTRGGVQGFADTLQDYTTNTPIISWGGITRSSSIVSKFTGKVYLDQMLPWDSVRLLRNQYMALSFMINKASNYYATSTRVQVFSGNSNLPTTGGSGGPDWAIDPLSGAWTDAVKIIDKDLNAVTANGTWYNVGCDLFQIPTGATTLMIRFVFDYTGNNNNDPSSGGVCAVTQVNLQPMDSRVTSINDWPKFERKPWAVEDYNCKRFYQTSSPYGNSFQNGETWGAEAVRLVASSTSANFNIKLPVKMQHTPKVRWYSAGTSMAYNKIWNQTSNADITVTGTSSYEVTTSTSIGAPTFAATGSANQLIMGHWEACAEGSANNSSYPW